MAISVKFSSGIVSKGCAFVILINIYRSYKNICLRKSLPVQCCSGFLYLLLSGSWTMISWYRFNMVFSRHEWGWASFHILKRNIWFSVNCLFHVFCPFFFWVVGPLFINLICRSFLYIREIIINLLWMSWKYF